MVNKEEADLNVSGEKRWEFIESNFKSEREITAKGLFGGTNREIHRKLSIIKVGGGGMNELKEILKLVGKLKDSAEEGSATNRFRNYMRENINDPKTIETWVEECLNTSDSQFNRALQDIVNHIGELLGFDVVYGRYRGVKNEIGYDGLWKSPSGKEQIIIETKTSDVYSIKTNQVLGYKNELLEKEIEEGQNIDKEDIFGIYVIGDKVAESNQLRNSIIAEKREKELRIIRINSLLKLLRVKEEYNTSHETVLTILLPSGPEIDQYINIISNLLLQEQEKTQHEVGESSVNIEYEEKQEETPQKDVPDTLIVPAREEGFQETFIGKDCWHAVRIADDKLDIIKYIAAYQTAPESGITHIAKVKEIKPYKDTDKYLLEFEAPAEKIDKVPLKNPDQAPMGPVYGIKEEIINAECVEEAKYNF